MTVPPIDFELWDAAVPLPAGSPRWMSPDEGKTVQAVGLPRGVTQPFVAAEPGVVVWTWGRERDSAWPTQQVMGEFFEVLRSEMGSAFDELSKRLRAMADGPSAPSTVRVNGEPMPARSYGVADGRWLIRAYLPDVDVVIAGNHIDVPELRPVDLSDWKF